jgi:hypothetical protein
VNCEVCGTELPHGALFCGECGRAVTVRAVRTEDETVGDGEASADVPSLPNPQWADDLFAEAESPELVDAGDEPATEFEPEAAAPAPASQANDTVIIDPFDLESLAQMPAVVPIVQAPDADGADPDSIEVAGIAQAPAADPGLLSDEIEQDLPADFDDPELVEEPEQSAEVHELAHEDEEAESPAERFAPAASVRPDPFPWGEPGAAPAAAAALAAVDPDDLEQTLIVPRRDTGERFVLQFSTGESVTVFGTGLLGRNPAPQPGEYFDQLVSISDPGKSVSKTHLEFGQEAGSFWVSDRFSGNGSVVREPGAPPKRLLGGKRYRIVRGTRVDIGEQFFVVS